VCLQLRENSVGFICAFQSAAYQHQRAQKPHRAKGKTASKPRVNSARPPDFRQQIPPLSANSAPLAALEIYLQLQSETQRDRDCQRRAAKVYQEIPKHLLREKWAAANLDKSCLCEG